MSMKQTSDQILQADTMYKWCTDYEYRKNEWLFRQSVAQSIQYGIHY